MFIEPNHTELGHSFRSAMFRETSEMKIALIGSDPTIEYAITFAIRIERRT